MNRIAVFLPNWIGDVVMATPAVRAVRERAMLLSKDGAVLSMRKRLEALGVWTSHRHPRGGGDPVLSQGA